MGNYRDIHVIQSILEDTKTIAVVGFSSRKERAGYYVPAYLQAQGYRIIPVNPSVDNALGEKGYSNLRDVPIPVDLVLIFRKSEAVKPFVEESVQIGAKAVWMQLGIINQSAAKLGLENGLQVVMDACMMVEHRRYKKG